MRLSAATLLIREHAARMDELCSATVFDELVIVEVVGEATYLRWYHGPRREDCIANFRGDTALLRKESHSRFSNHYEVGGYEFVPDGAGTQAEAFLTVGEHLYLIFNNTALSMAEIAANPLWLRAQAAFAELAESFQSDPLVIAADDLADQVLLK